MSLCCHAEQASRLLAQTGFMWRGRLVRPVSSEDRYLAGLMPLKTKILALLKHG